MEWNNNINIRITDEGRIFDENNKELFELTSQQQDVICEKLYPNDPIIKDAYTLSRRSKSKRGISLEKLIDQYGYDFIAYNDVYHTMEFNEDKLYQLGGNRLVELYRNNYNISMTAKQLGLSYHTLYRWIKRLLFKLSIVD